MSAVEQEAAPLEPTETVEVMNGEAAVENADTKKDNEVMISPFKLATLEKNNSAFIFVQDKIKEIWEVVGKENDIIEKQNTRGVLIERLEKLVKEMPGKTRESCLKRDHLLAKYAEVKAARELKKKNEARRKAAEEEKRQKELEQEQKRVEEEQAKAAKEALDAEIKKNLEVFKSGDQPAEADETQNVN